jgi:hypothetical protein
VIKLPDGYVIDVAWCSWQRIAQLTGYENRLRSARGPAAARCPAGHPGRLQRGCAMSPVTGSPGVPDPEEALMADKTDKQKEAEEKVRREREEEQRRQEQQGTPDKPGEQSGQQQQS